MAQFQKYSIIVVVAIGLGFICSPVKAQCNLLCNTDFEDTQVAPVGGYNIVDASQVPCWNTSATDNKIEVWYSGFSGVPSYSGNQFIELNAYQVATLFQNFTAPQGLTIAVSFAHRGRQGVDVMSVEIGPVGGPYTTLGSFSDGNTSWGYYTVNYTVPLGQGNNYSLRFNSISSTGGSSSIGNFLDAISVNLPSVNVVTSVSNINCNNTTGSATATASGGTLPYTYSWSTSPVQTTSTVTNLPAGSYLVIVTDSLGCSDSSVATINMSPLPNIDVRAGLNPLCDSTKLNWASWSTVNNTSGVGAISSTLSVTVTKPSGGLSTTPGMYNGGVFPTQYNVPANNTALRNDLAGVFTFCFSQPVINPQIAMSSIGNAGNSVQINTSSPYSVIWQGLGMAYPNDTTFVGTEGYTIIKFPGTHTCISFDYLQSETYCNLAFGTLDTNCQAMPPVPRCYGGADTLTASGALTYSWMPAAGLNTTSGPVVIATPTVTTTYYVTGYDADNCSAMDSITVTINPSPHALVSGDTVFCEGDSTVITVSGGETYFWQNLNINDSVVILKPLTNSSYTVLVSNSNGCMDSTTVNITINPLPEAVFSVPAVCWNAPTLVNESSTGNINSWNWNYGDGTVSTLQSPAHTYVACDTFDIQLIVTTGDGCKDTISHPAIVNCLPQADFNYTDACRNVPDTISDISTIQGSTINSWLWDVGDGTAPLTTQNISHTYTSEGSYIVTLIVGTASGCYDTAQNNLFIHPIPVPVINANNICAGAVVPFTNSSTISAPDNILSWVWDFADGNPVYNNSNISHSYPNAGSYIVKLKVISDFGCTDSVTKTIIVNPNPVVDFFATDTIGCSPLCISFQDLSSIPSPATNALWAWNIGDNSGLISSQAFDHCYNNVSNTSPAYYTVSLSVTSDSGCVTTKTKNNYITEYPNPLSSFIGEPVETSILDPEISIDNNSIGADSLFWNFGDNDTAFGINVMPHSYKDTGSYMITLYVGNQYGCKDTSAQRIIITPSFTFYIPSAFTPNGDGLNDVFIGQGEFIKEYTMSIFDRWGNLIYHTDDITKPWEGHVNNGTQLAQQDTYVYSIVVVDYKKQKHRYRGIVSLVGGKGNN